MSHSPTIGSDSGPVEVVLDGMAIGRGIAIGPLYRHDAESLSVPEYKIASGRISAERQRFSDAVERASHQVAELKEKARLLGGSAGEELGYLLDAYRHMLHGSRLVRGVRTRIETDRINAEAALQQEINTIVHSFEAMEDAYLAARVTDIRDVGRRLLRNLTSETPYRPFSSLPKGAVILADELTPADTALLDPKHVAGVATVLGGAESHTAIMARSLGFPAVLGVADLMKAARPGAIAIVDGGQGRVIIDPTPETIVLYRRKRAEFLRARRSLSRLRDVPAVTRDGAQLLLQANIELPTEVDTALAAGAEGIGLFRSEFLFMNRDDVPGEDEQVAMMRGVVERMGGRPVTIRTLDVGGDKLARGLGITPGPNPALGLRAVRLSLARPELLDIQLAAILRVSLIGPVRILVPMVASADEIRAVKAALLRARDTLLARGIDLPNELPPLGVMIEVPAAAVAADALAWHADFFSIGTNDLVQYTLAIDRGDEAVAALYNPLHPAVLRMIRMTADAAQQARIPVGVCGEIAGDPRFTALLMGLGIRDLSMSSSNIPVVKQRIRGLAVVDATRMARLVLKQTDPVQIARLLDKT